MIAAGIDVAEQRKGRDVVALDSDRSILLSLGKLSVGEAYEKVRELQPAVVCIDGPSGWSTSGPSRQAERELAQRGISSFATPRDPGSHSFYEWVRVAHRLYNKLSDHFPLYRGDALSGHAAEVFPNACAALLAGELRPEDQTKNRFRRGVLRSCGVDEAALSSVDRVGAALAAITGLEALEGRGAWIGDPAEGVILLPATLPSERLPRRIRSGARGSELAVERDDNGELVGVRLETTSEPKLGAPAEASHNAMVNRMSHSWRE